MGDEGGLVSVSVSVTSGANNHIQKEMAVIDEEDNL
jgi:hypothetical protein